MKKNFLIIFFYISPLLSFSQIMIGPKFGVNVATQFKSDFSVPKIGIVFGGAVDIPISSGISVQGEFLVSQKGYREEYKGKQIFDELTATYLEIPAMVKYTITKVNWAYYAQGGVYWSYWSSGNFQSSTDGTNTINEDYIFTGSFDQDGFKDNRSDFGAVIEAGVTYDNLGSGVLAIGLRYSHGFVATNSYQTPPADVVYNMNKVLTLSITYFLYL
jgi:outer membrane protein with beta-barrel domain